MSQKNLEKKIKIIISKILKVKIGSINSDNKANDYDTWDSLNNVKIFLEIKKIKKNIEISEYSKCKKVGDLIKLLNAK